MEIQLIEPTLALSKDLYLNGWLDRLGTEAHSLEGFAPNTPNAHVLHVEPEMPCNLWRAVRRRFYGILVDESNVSHIILLSENWPEGVLEQWYEIKNGQWVHEEKFIHQDDIGPEV